MEDVDEDTTSIDVGVFTLMTSFISTTLAFTTFLIFLFSFWVSIFDWKSRREEEVLYDNFTNFMAGKEPIEGVKEFMASLRRVGRAVSRQEGIVDEWKRGEESWNLA